MEIRSGEIPSGQWTDTLSLDGIGTQLYGLKVMLSFPWKNPSSRILFRKDDVNESGEIHVHGGGGSKA